MKLGISVACLRYNDSAKRERLRERERERERERMKERLINSLKVRERNMEEEKEIVLCF